MSLAAEVARLYEQGIVEAGKQPQLFLLLAFLATFVLVRVNTHLIRSGRIRWWPGNLQVGGTHIHHLVWGILLLLAVGYAALAFAPGGAWREVLAVLFGVGAGLTLDEFALWLNLEDVYWSERGRRSIDAVIVAAVLGGLVLLGVGVWIDLAEEVAFAVRALVAGTGVLGLVLAMVSAAKGRHLVAAVALLVPPVGLLGALRAAREGSPWQRLFAARGAEASAGVNPGGADAR